MIAPPSEQERGTADLAWKNSGQQDGSRPVSFQISDTLPKLDFLGGDLFIKSGAAAGKSIPLTKIAADKIVIGFAEPSILAQIKAGDEVQIDNSNFLAAQTYHRHQIPGKEYSVWDQFKDAAGKPMYPQRPMLIGPLFTRAASGILPNGKFKGHMIVLESLWDREAFPWQADWYRSKVKAALGDRLADRAKEHRLDQTRHQVLEKEGLLHRHHVRMSGNADAGRGDDIAAEHRDPVGQHRERVVDPRVVHRGSRLPLWVGGGEVDDRGVGVCRSRGVDRVGPAAVEDLARSVHD